MHDTRFTRGRTSQSGAGDTPALGDLDFDPDFQAGSHLHPPLLSLSPTTGEFGKVGAAAPRAHPGLEAAKGIPAPGPTWSWPKEEAPPHPERPQRILRRLRLFPAGSPESAGLQPPGCAPVPPQPRWPQPGAHPRPRLRSQKRRKAAMRQRNLNSLPASSLSPSSLPPSSLCPQWVTSAGRAGEELAVDGFVGGNSDGRWEAACWQQRELEMVSEQRRLLPALAKFGWALPVSDSTASVRSVGQQSAPKPSLRHPRRGFS